MLLFGHRFIDSEKFYHISDIDAIIHTPPSSTIYLEFNEKNLDIINHLNVNNIKSAISIKNITELIYISALNTTYAIVSKELAKKAQNIVENYLLDIKIIVKIENETEIEHMAELNIDGVVFPNTIIKTNS